jgi:CHASE2 domain-containing sensor protein
MSSAVDDVSVHSNSRLIPEKRFTRGLEIIFILALFGCVIIFVALVLVFPVVFIETMIIAVCAVVVLVTFSFLLVVTGEFLPDKIAFVARCALVVLLGVCTFMFGTKDVRKEQH